MYTNSKEYKEHEEKNKGKKRTTTCPKYLASPLTSPANN